jgi:hypothetical protein
LHLGDYALNGCVQAGRYFVCAHGSCTEVSEAVWNYRYWHALSAIGGILLIFIEAAIFVSSGDAVLDVDK